MSTDLGILSKLKSTVFVSLSLTFIIVSLGVLLKCVDYKRSELELFIIALLYSALFLSIVYLFVTHNRFTTENEGTILLKKMWLFVLFAGVALESSRHWAQFVSSIKGGISLRIYFKDILSNEASFLISIVFLSLLVDFVMVFFDEMESMHKRINDAYIRIRNVPEELDKVSQEVARTSTSVQEVANAVNSLVGNSKNEMQFLVKFNNTSLSVAFIDSIVNLKENLSKFLLSYNRNSLISIIAEIYINNFFGRFSNDKNNPININFGHFGIMSKMVLEILRQRDKFYNGFRKRDGENVKIVFFTTLTMTPRQYRTGCFFGENDYAKGKWSEFLGDYYGRGPESLISALARDATRYELKRVILVKNGEKIDGIMSRDDWNNMLQDDSDCDSYDCNCFTLKDANDFIRNAHPKEDDCGVFFMDNDFRVEYQEKSYVVSPVDGDLYLYKFVPIDIFAIGVKKDNEIKEWLGCIGGYLSGSLEYFPISWLDPVIAKDWGVINKYINHLFTHTFGYGVDASSSGRGMLFSGFIDSLNG